MSLQPNGDEIAYNTSNIIGHSNFNFFNVDMTYTWQFALGSFININWKDAIQNFDYETAYFKNLNNTLNTPQNNNFSIKIIYFLDYLSLRKKQ